MAVNTNGKPILEILPIIIDKMSRYRLKFIDTNDHFDVKVLRKQPRCNLKRKNVFFFCFCYKKLLPQKAMLLFVFNINKSRSVIRCVHNLPCFVYTRSSSLANTESFDDHGSKLLELV